MPPTDFLVMWFKVTVKCQIFVEMTSCKSLKSLLLDTVVTSYDTKIVPRKKMFPIKFSSQGQRSRSNYWSLYEYFLFNIFWHFLQKVAKLVTVATPRIIPIEFRSQGQGQTVNLHYMCCNAISCWLVTKP